MKPMSLIEMVQDILESLSSTPANSISDSSEAFQIATFIKNTYHNLLTNRNIPDFESLVKLVPYSDNRYPVLLHYPVDIKELKTIWYDVRGPNDQDASYKEILWLEPEAFLRRCDGHNSDRNFEMVEPFTGTTLYVRKDTDPTYWTTFDNQNIFFDAYDETKDSTIQASKLRAYGAYYPDFKIEDNFVPRLHGMYFPLLLGEAKATAFSLLKGYVDPKVEQMARRQRYSIQNDKYIDDRPNHWNDFGRAGAVRYRRKPSL